MLFTTVPRTSLVDGYDFAIYGTLPNVFLHPIIVENWNRCSSTSDQGRSKSDLVQRFPFIESWEGFAELEEEWTPDYSTDKTWRETRVPAFLEWLSEQPEKRIVVVGHGAFFSALLGRYLANCEVAEFVESAHGGRERLRGWQGL
eukprot:s3023_g2.t1